MRAALEDPREQLAWIARTLELLPRSLEPGEYFTPLQADSGRLRRHGFPARPDRATLRELHDFWEDLFSPPFELDADLPRLRSELEPALPLNFQSAGRATTPTRREASLNWSGGYITPRDGRMFTHVVGAFDMPLVSPPAGMPAGAEYGSSFWIGLDGQRSYLNSTLPQVGVAQHLNLNGVPGRTTSVWIQWWPLLPFMFSGFRVDPGHRVLCWLEVTDPTHVRGIVKNRTTGAFRGFIMQAPMVVDPPLFPAPVQAEVSGATAEWVAERPTSLTTHLLHELPDYGQVDFERCFAVSAPDPGRPGRVERLVGPRLIRMYRRADFNLRSATISVADRPADDSIRTRYRR